MIPKGGEGTPRGHLQEMGENQIMPNSRRSPHGGIRKKMTKITHPQGTVIKRASRGRAKIKIIFNPPEIQTQGTGTVILRANIVECQLMRHTHAGIYQEMRIFAGRRDPERLILVMFVVS